MVQRVKLLWIILLLVGVSLGCSLFQSTPDATEPPPPTAALVPTAVPDTPTPEPTTTPEPTAAPATVAPEGSTLEIVNETNADIVWLYLSPSDADAWGEDWLRDAIIPAGGSYTLAGIEDGIYDLQARDEFDEVIQTLWELEIAGDSYVVISAQATLEVDNLSGKEIGGLYISPTESDTWGEDVLGDETIPADSVFTVPGLEVGTYDIRVDTLDEQVIEIIYGVDLNGDYYWGVYGKADLPDNAVLRFEDDFTDNRNSWGGTSDVGVNYPPPADGEYCIEIINDSLTAWEWYEPFRPDQFIAEVACSPDEGTDASCGLGFGPDGDNLYWFEISPSDQSFALFLLLNDEWQDPLIEWTSSKNISPAGWNFLSLERLNGVVSVFVNGVQQGAVNSDYFPTGRIGLGGATYSDSNVTVCLDNLRVWRIE